MSVSIEGNEIHAAGYKLENWRHVDWLINILTTNAEILWGKRETAAAKHKAQSAAILKLVRDDPDGAN